MNPKQPVLWVIDNEQWPRACLRAELIERGYDAHGFMSIDDALNSSQIPEVIVLELRGQMVTKELIDRIRDLKVPTIVLGGNPELNQPEIQKSSWEFVLKRPVSLGRIADIVEQLHGNP